jgi:hypothetical protein
MTSEFLKLSISKMKTRKQEVRPDSVMGTMSLLHEIKSHMSDQIHTKFGT